MLEDEPITPEPLSSVPEEFDRERDLTMFGSVESLAAGAKEPDLMRLSQNQTRVIEVLATQSDGENQFDRWYFAALTTLHRSGPDALAQAAHSIREISDRFPRLVGVKIDSPLPPAKDAIRELIKVRESMFSNGWKGETITTKLAHILDRLTGLENNFALNRSSGLRLALEKSDPLSQHLSGEFRRLRDLNFSECYEFFQAVAHHYHIPDRLEFDLMLGRYERLILSYLAPTTAKNQEELLALIQAEPTIESTASLKELITHSASCFTLLLQKLDNEAWLPALRDFGLFSELPEPEPLDGGGFRYRNHMPLSCLARLASKSPELTLEILEGLPPSENPQILDQIVRCLSQIQEAGLIPRASKLLNKVLYSPKHEAHLWLRETLDCWTKLGRHEEVLSAIRQYFHRVLKRSGRSPSDQSSWMIKEIDKLCLPRLTDLNPRKTAQVLFYSLKEWAERQRAAEHSSPVLGKLLDALEDNRGIDSVDLPSTYWLDDFKSGPAYYAGNEAVVAMRLYAVGNSAFSSGDIARIKDFDDLLRQDAWRLFKHIRWELYAEFPRLSLELARGDALNTLSDLNKTLNQLELAEFRMFQAHSVVHGHDFLNPEEVDRLYQAILEGPLDQEGKLDTDEDYQAWFRQKQLLPFVTLFNAEQRETFDSLLPEKPVPTEQRYRSISSMGGARAVEHVLPQETDSFDDWSADQILSFLNEWQPNAESRHTREWWQKEDITGLAKAFIEHLQANPQKFSPETKWWEKLKRPIFISRLLASTLENLAARRKEGCERVTPDQVELGLLIDIANWIAFADVETDDDSECNDWYWARMEVIRLLKSLLSEESPAFVLDRSEKILLRLFSLRDPRLADKSKPWLDDWQSNAINSVAGTAMEGLMSLAHIQKQTGGGEISEEIRNSILAVLQSGEASPAIHALVGSRLRFFLFLFGDDVRQKPEIVLCNDNLRRNALILSNTLYDNPHVAVLQILPKFPEATLQCLEESQTSRDGEQKADRDFGNRIGTNLAWYYWNEAYENKAYGLSLLDKYFELATPNQRAGMLQSIGWMFQDVEPKVENPEMILRAQEVWERRFKQLIPGPEATKFTEVDYKKEVQGFMNWIKCEAFDFNWRINKALEAFERVDGPFEVFDLIRQLEKLATNSERLRGALLLVREIGKRETRAQHWDYEGEEFTALIRRGLSSDSAETKELAEEIRNIFLRLGYFDLHRQDGGK